MATPNMNLTLPTVGVTAGPAYATQINQALNVVDQHDHTSGSGVQITPAGLNINAALSIGSNDVTDVRTARFTAQGAALAGATPDLACLYVVGDNLYYNDGAGNQIAITASGSIAGSAGNITGLVSPASVVYTSGGSPNYKFMSTATVSANLDAASLIIRNPGVTATFGLTLQAPTLVNNYSITLPVLPAADSFLQIDSSGVVTTLNKLLSIGTANLIDESVTAIKLATDSVTTVKIVDSNVTTAKIADANVTKVKLAADAFYSVITQDLTGSTTFVVPAGVTGITATIVGGGGGGGGSAAAGQAGAGAGGNGGSIIVASVAVTPGESLIFTRGAGGTGGAGAGISGASGGSSTLTGSFGTIQAVGGLGGNAGSGGTGGPSQPSLRGSFPQASGGAGGSGTNGNTGDSSFRADGGTGGTASGGFGGGGGGGAGLTVGGSGGNAGQSGSTAASANTGAGGGGGGADSVAARSGGDGRNGRCIIQYIGSV